MNLLNTTKDPKNMDYTDSFRIQAVMLFPQDIERQRQHYAAMLVMYSLHLEHQLYHSKLSNDEEEKLRSDIIVLKHLLHQGYYECFWHSFDLRTPIFRECKERTHRGMIAGDKLYWLMRLSNHYQSLGEREDKASSRKATDMLEWELQNQVEKTELPARNEKTIREAWTEYESVAHLWLASTYLRSALKKDHFFDPQLQFILPQYIGTLCSYAARFWDFGINQVPMSQSTPNSVIKPENSIFPDIDWSLLGSPPSITIIPLDTCELAQLNKYKNNSK